MVKTARWSGSNKLSE